MYSNKILEIFKNPSCSGGLQGANGVGKYIDEVCGDFVKIYLKIDENQEIIEARFKTMGSVGTIVASSVLCGMLSKMSLADAQTLTSNNILEVTGEYPEDKKCSLEFAIRSLNLAIADYFQKLEKEDKPKRKKSKDGEVKKTIKEQAPEIIDDEEIEKPQAEEVSAKQDEPKVNDEDGLSLLNSNEIETNEEISQEPQTDINTQNDEEIENDNISAGQEEQSDIQQNQDIDDEYDSYFNDYDEELFEDNEDEKLQETERLDPVDIFLRTFGENAKTLEVKNMANGNKSVSLSSTEEDETEKASKMVEDAKSYKPVVETKITKGSISSEPKEQAKKSSAKAMFDAMFEE